MKDEMRVYFLEGGARESRKEWEKHKGEKSDLIESLCRKRPKVGNPISLHKLVVSLSEA